ncbi:hypothetical protein IFR05_001519 [Cadophora sp. M221]|nr:hypothetical protein IFR05_001519 [Cadophora sp. M221]
MASKQLAILTTSLPWHLRPKAPFQSSKGMMMHSHCTEITITDAPTCLTTTLTITTTVTEPEATHSAPFLTMPNPFPPASSHSAQMPHTSNSTNIDPVPASSVLSSIQSTSEAYQTWADPIPPSSIVDTPPQSTPDAQPPIVSSYIPQSTPVVEPPAPSTTADAPPPIAVSPEGIFGGSSGYTCQDNTSRQAFSSMNVHELTSGTGYCGHSADYCGNRCQSTFGYCTDISNDGTCGNGVTCVGGVLGIAALSFSFVAVARISVGLDVDRSLESAELLLSVRSQRIRLTIELRRYGCVS